MTAENSVVVFSSFVNHTNVLHKNIVVTVAPKLQTLFGLNFFYFTSPRTTLSLRDYLKD